MSNRTENFTNSDIPCYDPKLDGVLVVQHIVLAFTISLSIVINIIFLRILHSCLTFHPNVHFLLQNISCAILCQSLYDTAQCVYNVCLMIIGYGRTTINPSLCALFQCPDKLSTASITFSFLAIGLERIIFTRTKQSTQPFTEKSTLTIRVLAILTWVTGVPAVLEPIIKSRNFVVCYCNLSFVTRDVDLYITTVIFILVQLVAICLFPAVYYMNKSQLATFGLNSTRHSLVARTRAWRNVRTSTMLLLPAMLQGLVFTMTLILKLLTQIYFVDINVVNGLNIKLASVWLQLFTVFNIFHPILCVRRHHLLAVATKEKSNFLYWLSCRFTTIAEVDIVGQTENFSLNPDVQQNLLAHFWDKSPPNHNHHK